MEPDYKTVGYQFLLFEALFAKLKYILMEHDFRAKLVAGEMKYYIYARTEDSGTDRVPIITTTTMEAMCDAIKRLIRERRPTRQECELAVKRAQTAIEYNELLLDNLYDIDYEDQTDDEPELLNEGSEYLASALSPPGFNQSP